MEQNALTVLSRLVYKIFLPCLLFVNVTTTIATTNQGLDKLFLITATSVLMIFFGIAIGQVRQGSPAHSFHGNERLWTSKAGAALRGHQAVKGSPPKGCFQFGCPYINLPPRSIHLESDIINISSK